MSLGIKIVFVELGNNNVDKNNWMQRCRWLATPLGRFLLAAQALEMTRILQDTRLGRFGLVYHPEPLFSQIFSSCVEQLICLAMQNYPRCENVFAKKPNTTILTVASAAESLPFLENTLSMIIMPHILEYVANPKATLREALNALTGNGLIVITGFNPCSFWGLRRFIMMPTLRQRMPYNGEYIAPGRIRRWLVNADCQIIKMRTVYFRLPIANNTFQKCTQFMEALGRFCWPALGGAYVIVAQKTQLPYIPVREPWRMKDLLIAKDAIQPTPRSRA